MSDSDSDNTSDLDSNYDSESDISYHNASNTTYDTNTSCDSSWAHRSSFFEDFEEICDRDKKGEFHGVYCQIDDDGTVRSRCTYVHGRIQGVYREFHSNGRLALECNYEKGRRNGFCYTWHRNRVLESRCFYKDGFKSGVVYEWDRHGMLERHGGDIHHCYYGISQSFRGDGTLCSIDYNKSSRTKEGISLIWHENGQLRSRLGLKSGQPEGHDIDWDEHGKVVKNNYIHPTIYKPYYGEDIKIKDADMSEWEISE